GRKFAPRRFLRRSRNLAVQRVRGLVRRLHKPHAPAHQLGDLPAPQIRGQENPHLREIPPPVVAQGQRGFVQHAQQQLPQRIRGLFDLVEEQETKLQLLGVIFPQLFLRDQG